MNLENTARSISRRACIVCGQEFQGDTMVCPHDGTTLTPLIQEDMVGKVIGGKYEVLEVIGGGGMGMIYKAKHQLMKRIVAIKMMHPQYVSSASNLKRFQQEAQAASALSHPNILTVYDFGLTPEGAPYLVMDYLEGTNLAEVLDEFGYLPAERAAAIFAQTSAGLAHAHSKGVIHRDLKPGNIMLVELDKQKDFVKIVDFGIAKIMPMEGESSHLTQTGEVFGSPLYMSPEQCRGRDLDTRSDIYSLGCVMYRTLSGSSPFFGQDPLECMYKQVNEMPGKIFDQNPETQVPETLEAIVFKCLAKEPTERFQSMNELKDSLDAFLRGEPPAVPAPGQQSVGLTDSSGAATQPLAREQSQTPDLSRTSELTVPPSKSLAPEVSGTSVNAATPAPPNPASVSPGNEAAVTTNSAIIDAYKPAPPVPNTIATSKSKTSDLIKFAAICAVVLSLVIAGMMLFSPRQQPVLQSGSFDSNVDDAQAFYNKADYAAAEKKLNMILSAADLSNEKRAEALNLLGDVQKDAFEYAAAVKNYEQVLKIEEKEHLGKSESVAHALNGLGHIYTKKGDFVRAREYLNRALAIDKNFSGDAHIEFARTSFELGNMALKEGKISEASKYLSQAKAIIEAAKGENDPETATVYNALAQVYQYESKYKDAEKLYQKALQIRQTVLTPGNIETADTLLCLGTLNFHLHKYSTAEIQLLESLSAYERKFGTNNETVGEINFCLAVLYDQERKYSQAEPFYRKAFLIQKSILGPNNEKTLRTRKYYASLLTKLHKTDEAQKLLSGQ